LSIAAVRRRLFKWGRAHYRRFSWREDRDLYRLLVTEVLLKQTNATRVEGVRDHFLARYPNPRRLALAPEADIESQIRDLGLSRQRSGQLRELGRALELGSPGQSAVALSALPGIGAYSAATVACMTWGKRLPALDVNVARIVTRVFGISVARGEARRNAEVEHISALLVAGSKPRELNWALLDLGGTVCRPLPRCEQCPLATICRFRAVSAAD
jgi:A/G-specific adenine glycosylase